MFLPSIDILEKISKEILTPFFITDKNIIVDRLNLIRESFYGRMKIFYAVKANYNPHIIKILRDSGIDGIDTVSYYEILLAKKLGFSSDNILFTGVNNGKDELDLIINEGVIPNIGSLDEVIYFSQNYRDREFSLRINPGEGEGESKGVITAGEESKFGISTKHIPYILELVRDKKLKLIGIHNHIGSGFYEVEKFKKAVLVVLDIAKKIKGLKFLDFGGGFGIRYKKEDRKINMKNFYNSIKLELDDFENEYGHKLEYRLEPGKFLVGESTSFVAKVTDIKITDKINFMGVDTGMNHLPRYAFYGAFHNIENISKENLNKKRFRIVGNICESTDIICENILLPEDSEVGDTLIVQSTGAYCSSMSSNYNFRPNASEVIIDGDNFFISREKKSFNEMYNSLGFRDIII